MMSMILSQSLFRTAIVCRKLLLYCHSAASLYMSFSTICLIVSSDMSTYDSCQPLKPRRIVFGASAIEIIYVFHLLEPELTSSSSRRLLRSLKKRSFPVFLFNACISLIYSILY